MKLRTILSGLVLSGALLFSGTVAQATDSAALSSMPNGVSAISDVFTIPTLTPTNVAKIVQSTNTANPNAKAVQVTDAKSQVGAIWANTANKVDLSNNWTASMWMYFGSSSTPADGMAFVMQNVGTSAITSGLSSKIAPGQTLGVWGLDNNKATGSADTVAGRAIQKSWALEFDEFVNDSVAVGANSGYDHLSGNDGPHLASNYPGESSTYAVHGNSSLGYYTTMTHNGTIYSTLSDGAWHHVSLKWVAPTGSSTTGSMTYTFNDKNASSGLAQPATGSKTVNVDISKLGLTATSADKSVYWGFTGSTGTQYTNNMVVFESVPGLVNADTDLTVTDNTQDGRTVTDNDNINGKDALTYKYKLTYNSGTSDWKSIATKLKQNSNVTFNKGGIDYSNGDTESLTSTELGDTTAIAHTLKDSLSLTNPTATLTLKGTAKDVATNTSVASSLQSFSGTTNIGTVATPAFTIKPARQLTLSMSSGNATSVDAGKSINLQGMLVAESSAANDTLKNGDVTMHVSLDNGNTIDSFTMNGTSSDSTSSGYFNFNLPATKLTTGDNKVTVYGVDDNGNQSNQVTFTIKLNGTLAFSDLSGTVSFGSDNKIPTKETLLKASSDWSVKVSDTRTSGSKWYVYATASKLTSSQHDFDGNLVYIDSSGNKQVLTNKSALIANGASDGTTTATDIASGWSSSTGIFLDVQPSVYAGSYSGTVTWTLADTPGS
ncbi:extracellular protein [Lactobacillus zymae] [Lactiplantibacillus mudanjiangensis]|uniref:hypothetical protein n=1 Tax=Lactiplantibacillus mudanjiangensis TaxID=1296538 RepID=UPI001014BD0C|nr:hypothetical protein [Lactiplantibacillus mudanjiangensis]VDG33503.1 extracellular protein [Lactobacillus zymae] [Lactiplantibacillus mudanjiangensis]